MLTLKPNPEIALTCVYCSASGVDVQDFRFLGTQVVASCRCERCAGEFWYALPVGHATLYTIKISKDGKRISCPEASGGWLAEALHAALFKFPEAEARIEKQLFLEDQREEAVILNCLDSCFGHVYTKLWNASVLVRRYPEKSIIVLLPKHMGWLVPEGVAEIWTIEGPLGQLDRIIAPLDAFVKQEMKRFKAVALSPAHPHIDHEAVALEKLVKTKRFDLQQFASVPPQVTFVLREDRFWHDSKAAYLFYLACLKANVLPRFRWYFVRRQNQLVNKAARLIQKQIGNVKIRATGLGRSGKLAGTIEDLRTDAITETIEVEWCAVYAKSHLVIGVHGSNMLIPTSLAAGFLNILPRFKIPHIAEDTVLPYGNRYSIFLGRHLDQFVSPSLLSTHASSMIRDFPGLMHNAAQQP